MKLIMKLKLFSVIIIGLAVLSYFYSWYVGELVPAWQAVVWSFSCFTYALDEYVTARYNSLKLD